MVVDEEKQFVLTNYNQVKGETIVKDSDHNTLVLHMEITYTTFKPKRVEVFNFKHNEGQEAFKDVTTNTDKLSRCLISREPFSIQTSKWMKSLENFVKQSFPKRRITNKQIQTEENKLMDKRSRIKQQIKHTEDDVDKEVLEKEVELIEAELAKSVSKTNFEKIKENISLLTSINGSLSATGLWKVKQKKIPKHSKPLPVAKVDNHGRLISDPDELKKLYIDTYVHRLRQRPIRPELKELEILKSELFNKRIKLIKMKQFEPWNLDNLRYVLRSLKKNKSMDPHGLINELFRPENIGHDLEFSLLLLFNKIKQNLTIPHFMQFANIVSIYKGEKSKNSLENDRGIFILNIFRSILMKIIYNEEYETINKNYVRF